VRKLLVILLLGAMLFSLVGCSSPPETQVPPSNGDNSEVTKKDDLYVVATLLSGLDYFIDYKRALEVVGEEMGVKTEFVGPADYDINGLIATIEQSIAKGATGIILLGWEDALTPVINKAVEEGVYVVTTAQDLPDSKRHTFIGQGNYDAGKLAAEYMAEQLNYKGQVAVLRGITLTNVAERFQGFKEIIESYPDMELVADMDNRNDEIVAAQQAASVMQLYPDLAGFLAADGISGPAVATAVREAGKKGEVKVVAYDRDPTVLKGIEDGLITATLVAGTPLEIYMAVKIMDMMKYSSLQLSYDDAAAGITFRPSYIDPSCTVVDINSVKYFKRDYK
jgi:ribose transport system substrate-binding protein